jgi:hypothetical protein
LTKISTSKNSVILYFEALAASANIRASSENITLFNNNGRIVLSGSGDVGIGTNNPGARLDVSGSAIVSGTLTIAPSNAIELQVASTGVKIGNISTDIHTVTGSLNISGSVAGNVTALTISSNTASLDLNRGNFFTLQLVPGTNTHINPSNIKPGQTVNILVSTTGSATVTFPSTVLQPSGFSYVATPATGKDILTMVSFNTSSLYLANVKNLI